MYCSIDMLFHRLYKHCHFLLKLFPTIYIQTLSFLMRTYVWTLLYSTVASFHHLTIHTLLYSTEALFHHLWICISICRTPHHAMFSALVPVPIFHTGNTLSPNWTERGGVSWLSTVTTQQARELHKRIHICNVNET